MIKRTLLIVLAATTLLGASAQTKDGGIDAKMLEKLRKGYTASPEQRAVKNALHPPLSPFSRLMETTLRCATRTSRTA